MTKPVLVTFDHDQHSNPYGIVLDARQPGADHARTVLRVVERDSWEYRYRCPCPIPLVLLDALLADGVQYLHCWEKHASRVWVAALVDIARLGRRVVRQKEDTIYLAAEHWNCIETALWYAVPNRIGDVRSVDASRQISVLRHPQRRIRISPEAQPAQPDLFSQGAVTQPELAEMKGTRNGHGHGPYTDASRPEPEG